MAMAARPMPKGQVDVERVELRDIGVEVPRRTRAHHRTNLL